MDRRDGGEILTDCGKGVDREYEDEVVVCVDANMNILSPIAEWGLFT